MNDSTKDKLRDLKRTLRAEARDAKARDAKAQARKARHARVEIIERDEWRAFKAECVRLKK